MRYLELFHLKDKRTESLLKTCPMESNAGSEIVRALATRPLLLILDEPAARYESQETQELMGLIRHIRDEFNLTILLIEHDMSLVMGVCERLYVLDYGQIIAEGTPAEIRSNRKVLKHIWERDVE